MEAPSKPQKAPKPIFPNKFRLSSDAAGSTSAAGALATAAPTPAQRGSANDTMPKNTINKTSPPKLWNHRPSARPRAATSMRPPMRRAPKAIVKDLFSTIQEPLGPARYDRLLEMTEASSLKINTTVAHRFKATKNPAVAPKRSLAHW